MKYNQNLKEMRIKKGYNQTQIAEILNTTQETYYRYESGQRQMPIEQYKTLATFYNCSIDVLSGYKNT